DSIESYLLENLQLSMKYIDNNCKNRLDGSFPSVHSIISVLLICYLWQFIDRFYLKLLAILYIIIVGLSRVSLYMHFPADVIYGYFIGLIYYIIFVYISNLLIKIYYKRFIDKLYDVF
ncbi:MAG: phosphatase PAP2 family protein, partial [Rickettsiales bacterium]